MLSTRFLSLLACLPFVLSSPTNIFANLVVLEQLDTIPNGFMKSGGVPSNQTLDLRLGLVQGNMTGLAQKHLAVSNPNATEYGRHLSKEQVEKFVRPTNETITLVNEWLTTNGLNATSISPAGDLLSLSVSVSEASALFDSEFSVFTYQPTGQQTVRTLAYSIPAALRGHLDFVHPMTTFDVSSSRKPIISSPITHSSNNSTPGSANITSRAVAAACAKTITPACLQALYGIPTTRATQSSNTIGVTGFDNQFANQADLTTFLKGMRSDMSSSTTFAVQEVDGGKDTQTKADAGAEANLNIQYTVGLATGVPTTFITVGDDSMTGFLDVVNSLLSQSNPPHVITTSYSQNENAVSRSVANNLCNAYMQLGARGVTVLFASGDGGVSGTSPDSCTTSFIPTFPSTCPFVTSIGATTGIAPETAASFSAGGFSNYFAMPSYQASVVDAFLIAQGTTNIGKFNKSGRAFPDISAQGENVEFAFEGEVCSASSTGISSPIVASVIALLNDELIANGKPPLGFLNPLLYSTASKAFNDITSGSNSGCGANAKGFTARAGWDPVSGMGTPNFAKLRTAVGLA